MKYYPCMKSINTFYLVCERREKREKEQRCVQEEDMVKKAAALVTGRLAAQFFGGFAHLLQIL